MQYTLEVLFAVVSSISMALGSHFLRHIQKVNIHPSNNADNRATSPEVMPKGQKNVTKWESVGMSVLWMALNMWFLKWIRFCNA